MNGRSGQAGRALLGLLLAIVIGACADIGPTATVSPTPTASPTATVSPTPTVSPTATASPTATVSPTPTATPTTTPTATPSPGPPYPSAQPGVSVYDYAGVLSAAAETSATGLIADIERASGADVVLYTQYKPGSTEASTGRDALALMQQWDVGGSLGNGLVILLNTTRPTCTTQTTGNGQLQMHAGAGFATKLMTPTELQNLFDTKMLPVLRQCDIEGALLLALRKVRARALASA
jgi:hypothetical protein